MAESLKDRLIHAYNAFSGRVPASGWSVGSSRSYDPSRSLTVMSSDRSIVSTVYNIISLDVAMTPIRHVRVGQNGRFEEEVRSGLNECLTLDPNIDQIGSSFIQDCVLRMFETGSVAIVPVDASLDPRYSDSYDIRSLRAGEVMEWYPRHVKVRLYNDKRGEKQELLLPKSSVAVVQNPLYEVMNKENSTLSRLSRKLSMLDLIDEKTYSGKLDIIIQLPYTIKSEAMQKRAERRRRDIETQLTDSRYGIAYIDGTERVTQLNRPAENNLLEQIKFLTTQLYSRLGLTEVVFDGTATEEVYTQYWNRTVRPILKAITDSMTRTFLTKTARSRGQRVLYLRDPLATASPSNLIPFLNTLLTAEVISSNEARSFMMLPPAPDEQADRLQNANINTVVDTPPSEEAIGDTPMSEIVEGG